MSSSPQESATENTDDPTTKHTDNRDAHHLHEFGDIDNVVHVPRHSKEHAGHEDPVSPVHIRSKLARRDRWTRLRANLFKERHLMQYFHDGTLYRARELRKVSREELFLDLVIVAVIAALGHELRAAEITWKSVEKFMVLFAAVYSAWRMVVVLWNWWGVKEDILEKLGIYLSFVTITGIGLGSHAAFDDGVRPFVAISAFLATLGPASASSVLASREKLMQNPLNRTNQMYVFTGSALLCVLPYFVVAFVGSRDATVALYWVAFGLQVFNLFIPFFIYRAIHANVKGHTTLALNIELMAEKFEVLTMIVLGESVIGILFEAGTLVSKEGARVGMMYLSAIGSTAILYALQTYYIQTDNIILKGGVHAVRYNRYAGLIWSTAHMPYHLCLILFATGVGFGLRDIVVPPKGKEAAKMIAETLVRAGGDSSTVGKVQQFTKSARWVYSVGWGGALIFSGVFAAVHHGGVRAASKRIRLSIRAAVVIAVMVGMPFANVSAGEFQAIFVGVTVLLGTSEFLLTHMDRIGFFRSENSTTKSSVDSLGELKQREDGGLFLTDGSDDGDNDGGVASSEVPDLEAGQGSSLDKASSGDVVAQQLKARLCKGHCARMEVVKPKGLRKMKAENQTKNAADEKEINSGEQGQGAGLD